MRHISTEVLLLPDLSLQILPGPLQGCFVRRKLVAFEEIKLPVETAAMLGTCCVTNGLSRVDSQSWVFFARVFLEFFALGVRTRSGLLPHRLKLARIQQLIVPEPHQRVSGFVQHFATEAVLPDTGT
eukprot:INCI1243.1.p1 GENE.INCI1243.1~~INCI1243.1.p1  ORF type:complete len:127 (-),score=5.90 INCI1243.1:106-486(-)